MVSPLVVPNQGGLQQGGLSSRQSLIRVVSHVAVSCQDSLHKGDLSRRRSLSRMVSHMGSLSSGGLLSI